MKKNFTVNITGIIFHIDEDAYEKLDIYLKNIKQHFENTDTSEEIVADIESRIAEMLKEKITDTKTVITIEDVSEVIDRMGQPYEISGEDSSSEQNQSAKQKSRKRLYRDPDNKILGGVCGGISAYFNIDPVWLRLAFAISFFIFGFGTMIYIILWIVMPLARTTAEKLEMRGEDVNIASIEKSIREEFESVKNKFNEIKADAKSGKHKKYTKGISGFFEKTGDFIAVLAMYFVKTISIIVGVVFILVGVFLITGFISSFISFDKYSFISSGGMTSFSIPFLLESFFDSSKQFTLAVTGLSLFAGVPLIMLIYNGIKMVFRFKIRTKIVGISAFSLWLAGLVICGVVALNIIEDFNYDVTVTKKYSCKFNKNKDLHLYTLAEPELDSLFDAKNRYLLGNWNMVSTEKENILFGVPQIEIIPSENDSIKISIFAIAKGKNKSYAYNRANKILYNVSCNDTAVLLSPYYRLPENEKWRGQEIKIILKIPEGKNIYLDKSMEKLLLTASNFEEYWDLDINGGKWTMGKNGLTSVSESDSIQNIKNIE